MGQTFGGNSVAPLSMRFVTIAGTQGRVLMTLQACTALAFMYIFVYFWPYKTKASVRHRKMELLCVRKL